MVSNEIQFFLVHADCFYFIGSEFSRIVFTQKELCPVDVGDAKPHFVFDQRRRLEAQYGDRDQSGRNEEQ